MAVSISWGVLKKWFRASWKEFGLIEGRFRAEPRENSMAVGLMSEILGRALELAP